MKHSPLTGVVLLLGFLAGNLSGQVVLFRDDFEGPLADDWFQKLGQPGSREIVDGRYYLTPETPDQPMNPALDGMPDDISIRSSVQLIGENPASGFVASGVGARDIIFDGGAGPNIWGQLATDGRFGIGGGGTILAVGTSPTFNLFDDEIAFQLDMVGDLQLFSAWVAGTPAPSEPLVVSENSAASGEWFWLTHTNVATTELVTAAYGFVEIVGFSPCNLNRELACDITDLDALVSSGDLTNGFDVRVGKIVRYDLDQDGTVDTADLEKWLADAASENGFSEAYIVGDANLDGMVDSSDLNALALSWNQEGKTWSQGDFDGDGRVGSSDLNSLALNWNQSIAVAAPPVPEPSSGFLFTLISAVIVGWVRRQERRVEPRSLDG